MKRVEIFTKRLIDSVWTIIALVDEDNSTVEILEFDRTIELGYDHEYKTRRASFIESKDGKRTVEKLAVFKGQYFESTLDKVYTVSNPQYVFSYSD